MDVTHTKSAGVSLGFNENSSIYKAKTPIPHLPADAGKGRPHTGSGIVKMDDPICTVQVTCGALTVRSGAGTSYGRIGGVTYGKTLNVYEIKDGWLKIGYGTEYGWVLAKYTTYQDTTDPDPKPDPVSPCAEDLASKYGTIQQGSSGEGVKALHERLNLFLKDYDLPELSGSSFNKQTFTHLCYYQYSRNLQGSKGIEVDGICGSKTWKALCSSEPEVYNIKEPKIFRNYKCYGAFSGVQLHGSQKGYLTSEAAASFNAMYDDAISDGIDLTASNSFRGMTKWETKKGSGQDKNGQIEFYADYIFGGKKVETAAPGSSNHQQGISVDLLYIKDMQNDTTPQHNWLTNNNCAKAKKYHFKELPSECWHWTYTPDYK